jgi:hypothetical protein
MNLLPAAACADFHWRRNSSSLDLR